MSLFWQRASIARRPGTLWLAAVSLLAVAAAVSLTAPPIANAQLRAALGRALGTSDLRIRVSAWPPALWWGRVDVMAVEARRLRVGALDVDTFDATLTGVRFDPAALYMNRPLVIRSLGGAARAIVTQDALAALLNAQPSVRDAAVRLAAGRVSLAATMLAGGRPLRGGGTGRFVVRGDTAVDLVLDQVTVGAIVLRGALALAVIRSINPVLDLRMVPFGLRLAGVTVGDGTVTVEAVAAP